MVLLNYYVISSVAIILRKKTLNTLLQSLAQGAYVFYHQKRLKSKLLDRFYC